MKFCLRKKQLFSSLFIVFLLSMMVIPLINFPGVVSADGESWLTGWNFRVAHTINSASGADENYVVNVTVRNGTDSLTHFLSQMNFERYSENPVLEPWENSTVIMFPCIIEEEDCYSMFYSQNDPNTNGSIFLAETPNKTFPLDDWEDVSETSILPLGATGEWDDVLCVVQTVLKLDNGTYLMYYTGSGDPSGFPQAMGLATSQDRVNWTKDPANPLFSPSGDETNVEDFAVVRVDEDQWFLYYSFRNASHTLPTIRMANSSDGVSWSKQAGDKVLKGSTTYLEYHKAWYMFGYYIILCDVYISSVWKLHVYYSDDPYAVFTAYSGNPVFSPSGTPGSFDQYHVATPDLVYNSTYDSWFLFYQGGNASNYINAYWKLGEAFSENATGSTAWLNGSKFRADFGDIRFTQDDGITLIDYWMEYTRYDASVGDYYSLFWLKIPDNLTATSSTIYLYYGNAGAEDASNGEAVFELFDDFEDGSINATKWNVDNGVPVETGGKLVLEGAGAGNHDSVWSQNSVTIGSRVRFVAQWDAYDDGGLVGFTKTDSSEFSRVQSQGSSLKVRGLTVDGASNQATGFTASLDTDYTWDIYWKVSGGTGQFASYYQDDVHKFTHTGTAVPDLATNVLMVSYGGDPKVSVDFLFTYRYINPEPTHGEWGYEEEYEGFMVIPSATSEIFYPLQYDFVVAECLDLPDATAYINASITVDGDVVLLWDNATDTFSIHSDVNNYAILDSGSSYLAEINSTCFELYWCVCFRWNFTEGNKYGEGNGNSSVSGSAVPSSELLFYFENDIEINSVANDDNDGERVDAEQLITWSGQTYWEGTALHPFPDVAEDYCNVTLELAGVALTSVYISAGGSYSISYTANSTVDLFSYTLYGFTPAEEVSVSNQTDAVIVDKVVLNVWMADDYDVLLETQVNFTIANFSSAYDGSAFSGNYFMISRNGTDWEPLKTENFSDSQADLGYYVYEVSAVDNNFNITQVNEDPGNLVVVWYNTEPGGGEAEDDWTDPHDLAGVVVISLIFIPILIIAIVAITRRRK